MIILTLITCSETSLTKFLYVESYKCGKTEQDAYDGKLLHKSNHRPLCQFSWSFFVIPDEKMQNLKFGGNVTISN